MRRRQRFPPVLILLALTLVPSPAFADWFFAAGIGRSSSDSFLASPQTFTGQLGAKGDGWIGFEGDYSFMKEIRGGVHARTVTASLLIGPRRGRLQIFGSVGGGIIGGVGKFSHIFNPLDEHVSNEAVVSFGGGVMFDLSPRFGVRGDVRAFRALQEFEDEPVPLSVTQVAGGVFVKF
jgi:hypothetical protein